MQVFGAVFFLEGGGAVIFYGFAHDAIIMYET